MPISPSEHPSASDPRDVEYQRAWRQAPASFKREAAKLGLECEVNRTTGASIEYDNNYESASYTPDVAQSIDDYLEGLIEKHGSQHEELIRKMAADLFKPYQEEAEKLRSLNLARMGMFLLDGEKKNMRAKAHAFLHAVPLLAEANGFGSLTQSAKDAGCSKEWMRRTRDALCNMFGIPVPESGKKSEEAKQKYKEREHWTTQRFKFTPTHPTTLCQSQTPAT